MESALLSASSSALSILSRSKTLNSHSSPLIGHLHRQLCTIRATQLAHIRLRSCIGSNFLVQGARSFQPHRNPLQFAASYSVSFSSGGRGFGGNVGGGGNGGKGDGAADGGDTKPSAVAPGSADAAPSGSDVIILDVTGMTCGGCAASVKRILESLPQVSSANVNLTTETAIVWPVSEVKVVPNWKKDIGEALAKHLTTCGFASNLRDQGASDKEIQS